ncbi:hypothetical protein ACH4NT_04495 [Streptomyces lydicus]
MASVQKSAQADSRASVADCRTGRTVTAGTHGRRYEALVALACLRRRLP